MKKFDSNDLKILRGQYTAIGRSIKSSRSKTGYISRYYVTLVLTGKVVRENETTRAIKEKAKRIIETLKS